jgi:hypothetical protein
MPAMSKQTKVWTDQYGKQERICDMPAPKLVGIMRMLKRAALIHRAIATVEIMDSDNADAHAGAALAAHLQRPWHDFLPAKDFFQAMVYDCMRRNIPWDDKPDVTDDAVVMQVSVERVRARLEASVANYVPGSSQAKREADL